MDTEPTGLDAMFEAYVKCALLASTEPGSGASLASWDYTIADLAPDTWQEMQWDCLQFLLDHAALIGDDYARAGHDFFLTRNRHSAGFWDGDWPEAVGAELTRAAHAYGPYELSIGDLGLIVGA